MNHKNYKPPLLVNFYGSPGSGKSTGATYCFSQMKLLGYNVEYLPELFKWQTYNTNLEDVDWDNVYNTQHKALVSMLDGADIVITDCPRHLHSYYQEIRQKSIPLVRELNILVYRVKPYNPNGRWHTAEESDAILPELRKFLEESKIHIEVTIPGTEQGYKEVLKFIKGASLYDDFTH